MSNVLARNAANSNPERKVRDSNIELCRILSMLFIIMHHCVLHGGGVVMEDCTNRWIAYCYLPGGKIAFVTFMVISAWYLVDKPFKTERFIKAWLETLFYSVTTTIAAIILGSQISNLEVISAFLPMSGGVHGYPQVYLAFYLLIPLLNKITKDMTKKQNAYTILVFSIFVLFYRYISSIVPSEQSVYSRLYLFVYLYFLLLYIKRNPIKILENTTVMLVTFLLNWAIIVVYNIAAVKYPDLGLWRYVAILAYDEGCLLNLIGGLSFFFLFKSIKMRPSKFINFVGGATLAVIMIHDGHFFRGWTWALVHTSEWYYNSFYILLVPLCAIAIYAVCVPIDAFRKFCLEKPLFKAKWMKVLCQSIDDIFSKTPEKSIAAETVEAVSSTEQADRSVFVETNSVNSEQVIEIDTDQSEKKSAEIVIKVTLK